MEYLIQFTVIIVISMLGELLHALVPLPVPASIYGIFILLFCLHSRLLKLENVKGASDYLLKIMPVFFIPSAVLVIDAWDMISAKLLQYVLICIVPLVVGIITVGKVTQFVIRRNGGMKNAG